MTNDIKCYAIIVAGGSGTRMGTTVPKQFLSVNGLPVLMHTLLAFYNSTTKPHLILALPAGFHDYWKQLCVTHNFNIEHTLLTGGETRFHSAVHFILIKQVAVVTNKGRKAHYQTLTNRIYWWISNLREELLKVA